MSFKFHSIQDVRLTHQTVHFHMVNGQREYVTPLYRFGFWYELMQYSTMTGETVTIPQNEITSEVQPVWIVDYKLAADTLPQSVRWDALDVESQMEVIQAYLSGLLSEYGSNPRSEDMNEVMSKFFSEYWALIPEIEL